MSEEKDYVPFGEEWKKEMSKFKKKELIDMLCKEYEKSITKLNHTPKQLELYRQLGNIMEVFENLKKPLKFIDLLRDNDDPRKIMADIKYTIGQIRLQLAMQEMKEVAHPTKSPIQPCLGGKEGVMVSIRPCADEYKGKTYIGFLIGELAKSSSISVSDEKIQLEFSGYNPAIFFPEIGKIIYGYESWRGDITSEEDLKKITEEDIENVWYVKAYRQMLENNESTAKK